MKNIQTYLVTFLFFAFTYNVFCQYSGSLYTNSTFNSRQLSTSLPVGTISGQGGANEGAATYSIPLFVSPGTNKVTPSLGLVYSSMSGDGLLGRGWALTGLSAITRVNRNIHFDDAAGPVEMTKDDRFMLDGQRLVLITGTYGSDGATYGTEAENFATVYSYGTGAYGPEKFLVKHKDGRQIEYGYWWNEKEYAGSSDKVLKWFMNKITYPDGSYLTFHYTTVNSQKVIEYIKYTGNTYANQGTYNDIRFYYGQRTDQNKIYVAGHPLYSNNLLTQVDIIAEGSLAARYKLKYAHDNINSFLKEIERYGSDGTTKFNSTILKYGDQPIHFQSENTNITINNLPYSTSESDGYFTYTGEYNGDGYTDMMFAEFKNNGLNRFVIGFKTYARTPTNSNYTQMYSTLFSDNCQVANNELTHSAFYNSDYTGDGRDDILMAKISNDGKRVEGYRFYKSNGSGFDYMWINVPASHGYQDYKWIPDNGTKPYMAIGDFDGEGSTEYITLLHNEDAPGPKLYNLFINSEMTTSGNVIINMPGRTNGGFQSGIWWEPDHIRVVDFNGDGKADIMVTKDGTTKIYTLTRNGNAWTGHEIHSAGFPTKWHVIKAGDFNGDGKTDLLTRGDLTNINIPWKIALSTGTSWVESNFSFVVPPVIVNSHNTDLLSVRDYNGDGKSDIVHSWKEWNSTHTAQIMKMDAYYSKGNNQFYRKRENNTPLIASGQYTHPSDFNGDGRIDILATENIYTNLRIFHLNKEGKELLLEKVKNGLNHETQWSYKRMTQPSGFYTKGTTLTGDINNIQLPMNLVYQQKQSDGKGGYFTNSFTYKEGKIHKEGKGFLGFGEIVSKDLTRGFYSKSRKKYNSTYKLLLPDYTWNYKTSGNQLLSRNDINESVINRGNKRYWYRVNNTRLDKYLENQYFTTHFTYDSYGNSTNTVNRSYGNGSLIETNTTSVNSYGMYGTPVPDKPDVVTTSVLRAGQINYQTKVKNYWNSKGQLYRKDNFDGTPKEVRNYYYYNTNGTLKETRKESNGLVSRTNKYYYDAKGRYVETHKNPLDQSSVKTYDKRWGTPTSSSSVNGLSRAYTYDKFGRLETTNYTTEQYSTSESYHWNITSAGLTYYQKMTHPGAPDTKTWYDALGRERQTQVEGFQNQWITTKKEYDIKGNLLKDYSPYKSNETSLVTTYTYDTYNRPYQATNSLGTTTTTYAYPSGKTKTTTTNPTGQVSTQSVDATGKVTESTDNGGTLTYTYYSHGNVRYVKNGSTTLVSNQYDPYARQTKLIDINGGTISYEYDAFGQLIKETNANGQLHMMTYDKLGRMINKVLPEGTTNYTYYPTGSGKSTNQVKKITAFSGVSEEYTYDTYGFVRTKKETINSFPYTTTFTNDKYGRTTDILYPSGFGIKQNYDVNGYLTTIKNSSQSVTLFTNLDMNGYSQYKAYKLGNNKYSYQTFHHGIPTRYYTSGVQDLNQIWDYTTGNLNNRYDAIKNKREYFQYDNLNRLKKSYGSGLQTIDINYAANGNINSKTDAGTYSYHNAKINAISHVTNSQSNIPTLTQDIAYTSFHQPSQLSEGGYTLEYTYGSDEQRAMSVLKQNGSQVGARFYFDGFEKDVKGFNAQWLHYISAGENIIAIVKRVGSTDSYYYTYTDHLGSIVRVTDQAGTTVAEQNFDAWGRKRNPSTWTYSNVPTTPDWLYRGYTMHEGMPQFKLINMNGRMYDPVVGRMLSVDNFINENAGTQGYNRYSYALNNPLKYTDPDGEFVFAVAIGIFINVAVQGVQGKLNNWGDFFGAVAVGGLSGLAGYGAGNIVSGVGAWSGAGAGALGGGAGGLVGNAGNAWLGGADFSGILNAGLQGAGWGALSGGIIGGVVGGIHASKEGKNFWTGGEKAKVYTSPVGDNFGKQNGECIYRCLEEGANSYGESNYDFNYWYKNNNSGLGVHASDIENLIESSVIFKSDRISVNPFKKDVSNIAKAFSNNKRVIAGFNTKTGAHGVLVKKVKIWSSGKYRIWFTETSPVRIAPISSSNLLKDFIAPPSFWTFYK